MKFHTYADNYGAILKQMGWPRTESSDDITMLVEAFIRTSRKQGNAGNDTVNRAAFLGGTGCWVLDHRPYYSLYPKVVDSLIKTPLTTTIDNLQYPTRSNCLLLRLAVGHELPGGVQAIFVAPMTARYTDDHVILLVTQTEREMHTGTYTCKPGTTIEEIFKQPIDAHEGEVDPNMLHPCLRLALGVALLDHDPELIRPDVLERDRGKLDDTIDPARMADLARRAHQRGKVGWVVGECTDPAHTGPVAAHYRRGHWGFRWAGPKRSRLKWTKIKGSIIHKDKMTEVPTGYLDEETNEDPTTRSEATQID